MKSKKIIILAFVITISLICAASIARPKNKSIKAKVTTIKVESSEPIGGLLSDYKL